MIQDFPVNLRIEKIDPSEIPNDVVSVVGHQDIATILTNVLGFEVPFNRTTVQVTRGDTLYVGQYVGPRLPEGTQVLPEGSRIDYFVVELK